MKKVCWGHLLVLLVVCVGRVSGFDADPFGMEVRFDGESEPQALQVFFTVPEKHYLYKDHLEVTAEGAVLEELSRPEAVEVDDPFLGEIVAVYQEDFVIRYQVVEADPAGFDLTVRYMGCDDEICFMPQTHVIRVGASAEDGKDADIAQAEGLEAVGTVFDGFEILGIDAGYRNVSEFLGFLERVEAGRGLEKRGIEALVAGRGIWIGILAILLGGLALNLTPCVLPMIPINLAIIGAGTQAGSRKRGFWLGGVYGAGIALVYGILGVVVVLTGAQFGTLNANPWFNLGIGILFAVLAFAMFDVFQIDFSRYQNFLSGNQQRGPVWTALLFGGVAALLAGACVAPVVISVLILSTGFYQEGHRMALFLPFVLGIGMALPWPFAGAGLSFLPKPGPWMDRVKKGFGVLILLAALYYGYQGVRLLQWTGGVSELADDDDRFWLHDPAEAVEVARTTGTPLFVDFWATWCRNCLAMDRTTFQDASVREALEPYVRLKFQAENPADPATKRVLDQLGVKGLPSYVILRP